LYILYEIKIDTNKGNRGGKTKPTIPSNMYFHGIFFMFI
jgi:hypothetical protein